MSQLEVKTKSEVGIVEFNFEELKSDLATNLQKYNGLVITDETQITEYKEVKSSLNKVKKAINDEKIRIKKEYCRPLTMFEEQTKELMSMVDDVSKPIDDQLKAFEDKRKDEKKQSIADYFDTLDFTLVDFDKLFNEKWLNKGCKDKEWQDDLTFKVREIENGLKTIDLLGSVEYSTLVKSFYISGNTFSNEGIGIAKGKADKQRTIIQQVDVKPKQEVKKEAVEQQGVVAKDEEEVMSTFSILATTTEKLELIDYMKQRGVKFRKARKEDIEE